MARSSPTVTILRTAAPEGAFGVTGSATKVFTTAAISTNCTGFDWGCRGNSTAERRQGQLRIADVRLTSVRLGTRLSFQTRVDFRFGEITSRCDPVEFDIGCREPGKSADENSALHDYG